MLSVVVLARGQVAATRRCLNALRRHTPGALEVLLVDNASPAADARKLAALARAWPAVRLARNRANRPFARAVNEALARARGRTLCLLNNDAVVGPRWRAELEGALAADPNAGAAGPLTTAMAPPAQLSPRRDAPPASTPVLGGFCLMFPRAAYEAAGPFDERFVWGWEDIDWVLRLRASGRRLLLVPRAFVRHDGSRTLASMPPAARRRGDLANRALFRAKWGSGALRDDAHAILARSPAPWDLELAEVSVRPIASAPPPRGLRAACRGLRAEWVEDRPGRHRVGGLPARSAGAEDCAPLLLLLGPGAVPSPGSVARLADALRAHPRAAAAGGPSRRTRLHWQRHPDGPEGPREVPFLRGGCLLVSRDAYVAAGGLDAALTPHDAEADLCMRLAAAGGRILLVPGADVGGGRPLGVPRPRAEASTRAMFERWGPAGRAFG